MKKNQDNLTIAEFVAFVLDEVTPESTFQNHDLTLELIKELEQLLLREYADDLNPIKAVLFAVLFGQTIVRNIQGAEWTNLESTNLSDMAVVIRPPYNDKGKLLIIHPIRNVNRVTQDHKHNMTGMFNLALAMSTLSIAEMKTFITRI